MARQIQPTNRVAKLRRLWPYVLMAWERWQQLSPEDKERYKKQARGYAERGRKVYDERRKGRPPKR
jgi:glycogen debranching enzyme